MRAFSPNQIKADVLFLASVAATFGFNLSNVQTTVLLGSTGLIAAVANFAEAHVHVGKTVAGSIDKVRAEVRALLPSINQLVGALPGQVGEEIRKALGAVEKGPAAAETPKAASKPAGK